MSQRPPDERVCPQCQRVNAGRDFCGGCGEYLRWEPTMFIPAIDPGRVAVVSRPPQALRAALVPHVANLSRPEAQAALTLSAPGPIGVTCIEPTPAADAPISTILSRYFSAGILPVNTS